MKKIHQFLIAPILIGLLISCMGDSPKTAAEKFLNSFNKRDFAEARKYATPETNKLIDLMENLTKMSQTQDSAVNKKIEILGQRVEGEIAYVTFKEDGSESTEELKLKKIDGKWMAHVTKEDIAAKDMPGGKDEEGLMMESDSTDFVPQDSSAEVSR